MSISKTPATFQSFFKEITAAAPVLSLVVCLLSILFVFIEGIGLFLIIPLLSLAGIGEQTDRITEWANSITSTIGIDLTLEKILLIFPLLILLRIIAGLFRERVDIKLRGKLSTAFRKKFLKTCWGMPWELFSTKHPGGLLHLATADVDRMSYGVHALVSLLVALFLLIICFSLSLFTAPTLTVLLFFSVFILHLIFQRTIRWSYSAGESYSKADSNLYRDFSEFLSGQKLLRMSSKQSEHDSRIFQSMCSLIRSEERFTMAQQGSVSLLQFFCAVLLAIMTYIAIQILNISTFSLLVLLAFSLRAIPLFLRAQRSLEHIRGVLPAYQRLAELFYSEKSPPHKGKKKILFHDAVSLDDIHYSYQIGLEPVLNGVSFHIPFGSCIGLEGESGSGKTTLAYILSGIINSHDGKILIDRTPLKDISLEYWKSQVQYVDHDPYFFSDTLERNLSRFVKDIDKTLVFDLLDRVGLQKRISSARGLDTILGENGIRLSCGEQQRLAIVRALLQEPRLLILDEATSGMEYDLEEQIFDLLSEYQQEMAVLWISHRGTMNDVADIVYRLENREVSKISE